MEEQLYHFIIYQKLIIFKIQGKKLGRFQKYKFVLIKLNKIQKIDKDWRKVKHFISLLKILMFITRKPMNRYQCTDKIVKKACIQNKKSLQENR